MPYFWYFLFLSYLGFICEGKSERILLRDVSTLTFFRDQFTNARRTSPIPQLKCVGGSASGEKKYYPLVVQCYNRGQDGIDVQWECKAELHKAVFLGRVRVNCEGYGYAEDPYVLAGSCGLEYELEYHDKRKPHGAHSKYLFNSPGHTQYAALLGLLASAALIWYFCLSSARVERTVEPVTSHTNRSYMDASAPPYPERDPPTYEEAMHNEQTPPYDDTHTYRRQQPTSQPPSYGWADLPSESPFSDHSSSYTPRQSRFFNRDSHKTNAPQTESESGSWLTHGLAAGAGFLGGYLLRPAANNSDTISPIRSERHHQSPRYGVFTEPERRRSSSNSSEDRHVSTSYGSTTRR